jgi:hypothetical protein
VDTDTLWHLTNYIIGGFGPDRCDLSLFQLGLRLLHHLLKEDKPIPVGFLLLNDPFG